MQLPTPRHDTPTTLSVSHRSSAPRPSLPPAHCIGAGAVEAPFTPPTPLPTPPQVREIASLMPLSLPGNVAILAAVVGASSRARPAPPLMSASPSPQLLVRLRRLRGVAPLRSGGGRRRRREQHRHNARRRRGGRRGGRG